ncbi:hypothetical protein I3842_04G006300 [Carya illinoinensis]|uniref:LRAT domain-containing protein n=1 Tax=Carya illinoinensis TaxID=32201 RepID=A0A922F7Y5_CARIL|nr:hypothetical protein I3842_04G006300 [Carya illinoinensis]
MGVLSNKIERENLKPGDHIYTWRRAYAYAHHGQEIGSGPVLDRIIVSSSPSYRPMGIPCSGCGDQSNLNGVIVSCIDCFLSGGNLYLFKYGVSRAFFLAKVRGGTCTRASSDPPEVVIHRAKYLLGNGFGSYDIFKNNCEDFALYCKTGLLVRRSGQVASFNAAVGSAANVAVDAAASAATNATISSPLQSRATSFSGGTIVLTVLVYGVMYGISYCTNLLDSDIGVCGDAVAVESLVAPSGSNESEASNELKASGSNYSKASNESEASKSNESEAVTEMFKGG